MRRRHQYDEKRGMTVCGHPVTEQEKRFMRMHKPHNINCKRCQTMMRKHTKA